MLDIVAVVRHLKYEMKSLSKFEIALPWLLDIAKNMCTFSQGACVTGCPLVLESRGIFEDHFRGLKGHGKQQSLWKVMEVPGK